MGEVKSTLDLVMQKTKHLTLSESEKAAQQRAEREKRLKGLLQKVADGILPVESFPEKLQALQDPPGTEGQAALVRQLLSRVDPDQDSSRWLALLEMYAPDRVTAIEDMLAAYRQRRESLLQTSRQKEVARLKADHRIQGSAVVPNPDRDRQFRQELAAVRQAFHSRLAASCQV